LKVDAVLTGRGQIEFKNQSGVVAEHGRCVLVAEHEHVVPVRFRTPDTGSGQLQKAIIPVVFMNGIARSRITCCVQFWFNE